ncbi:Palmitoyltransferase ZDHHC7 [Phytophthora cinnamomi]|uniref:Palmitoyltransferase ZDHHC7 n=1 Tax=Phytophthora cinnamomi TaxID=4785 RepID=UPI00355A1F89|nr:Palmitoyltransferase ZDHHC7 [Phytophthora cinnamomi]
MSVVTRVLYGAAKVTSYDIVSDAEIQTLEAGDEIAYEDATFTADAINPADGSVSWARVSREDSSAGDYHHVAGPTSFQSHNIQKS